jgi:hypothetical protein
MPLAGDRGRVDAVHAAGVALGDPGAVTLARHLARRIAAQPTEPFTGCGHGAWARAAILRNATTLSRVAEGVRAIKWSPAPTRRLRCPGPVRR